ncbi:MAG: ATP synthase F1 subunit gamma [Muribaculaceae bacterium]|nr:ATP synthase F1 subunit gamma [Muribaculaceae bacterium]
MATLRELKGRIGSVGSSEKITGAMKMISSAKMHKAEGAIRRLLPYRTQLENIIGNLLQAEAEFTSPLTDAREVKRAYVVVLGSDDGLCGAYNVNIFKQLIAHIDALRSELGDDKLPVTVYPVGSKMLKACRRLAIPGVDVAEETGVNSKSSDADVKEFVMRLSADFLSGLADRVDFLYMSYQSVSRQRLKVQQILPVLPANLTNAEKSVTNRSYIFEPDAGTIFRSALPLMVLSSVQEIFCENRASEQAARVMAMQSANDNAKKLLEQLSLEYNKLRQQSITNELLDILGGQVR